ncbi:MAG: dihydroorotase, multifunctional complex type [Acidobacteria bacterium]|nr:dihydroorotase, multifunctional complex type [Acidobacteriota bacterium]
MQLILKQGRVVDPTQKINQIADVGIDDGRIVEIAAKIRRSGRKVIDARGLIVAPGFIDMHVHLREPGREDAETIETGTNAAACGGFTGVACMPNTTPVNDSEAVTSFILERAREVSKVAVYPVGAITKGSQGEALAEIGEMRRSGIVAISDDGRSVQNSQIMRRAMEYSKLFGIPVIDHCEDRNLAADGVMHEGYYSTILGMRGINPAAEEMHVVRDTILARYTGARLHIAHLSTRLSLETVKRAKKEKISVTCEVTPHHLLLTDAHVTSYDTNMKMNPPLRSQEDVDALVDGIVSGSIDVIATDHAPHNINDKMLEFDRAPFGVVGLETAVGLILDRFVRTGVLGIERMVEMFSTNPARILGLERGTLARGAVADITVLDPNRQWVVSSADFASRSRNTPFEGYRLRGAPAMTIVKGRVVWSV